jgi:hypothetical protein
MEQFLISFYDFYLELFFDFPIFNYQEWISLINTLSLTFIQSLLYYFGVFFTFPMFLEYLPEVGVGISLFWENSRISIEYFFMSTFPLLYLLNICTFFIWKYFWRKREKIKSNKINFYIIFFQFFPIIWFLGNFIAGKKYEITNIKGCMLNILTFILRGFQLLIYFVWINIFLDWNWNIVSFAIYTFFSGIFILLWSYFYYFKIKN